MDRWEFTVSIESQMSRVEIGGQPQSRIVLTLRDRFMDETQFLLDQDSTPNALLLALLRREEIIVKQKNRVNGNTLTIETVITWPAEGQ
jgi:hypothetical protein